MTRRGTAALALALFVGLLRAEPVEGPKLQYPVSEPPATLAKDYGAHVQRTMTLLATSTPEHRNKVRILVYGQSISEGVWWKYLEHDLRTRFPNADLEMVNRALGGHASNYLVREAETDVYPFYPDLVVFHVYGAHTCYEQIISRIRSRTAAEVLMTTDHLGAQEKPDAQNQIVDDKWTSYMASFIPQVAATYGCEVVNVRDPWKRYVLDNKLTAQSLLIDSIHLGPQGNALYAALIGRQLVYRPELKDKIDPEAVHTYEVGKDIQWKDGKLTLDFVGNRVLAIAGPAAANAAAATVLVDGKKPSEFKECYAFTRAQGAMGKILAVGSVQPPLVEDWTFRITAVDAAKKTFGYEMIGSKTGPDGRGNSTDRFVSTSGRIVLETKVEKPEMAIESDLAIDAARVKPGDEIKFQCYALHTDRYVAPSAKLLQDSALEHSTLLVQGIANGKHTLTLTAEGGGAEAAVAIQALRVYRPAVAPPAAMVYDTMHPPK
jgi:hypothetical protein